MLDNVYLITDTHGANVNVEGYESDTLIHLGDYISGTLHEFANLILIEGNHDTELKEHPFILVTGGLILGHSFLTHEPVERLPKGCHINIHGHLHDNVYEDYGYSQKDFHRLLKPGILYKWADIH